MNTFLHNESKPLDKQVFRKKKDLKTKKKTNRFQN